MNNLKKVLVVVVVVVIAGGVINALPDVITTEGLLGE